AKPLNSHASISVPAGGFALRNVGSVGPRVGIERLAVLVLQRIDVRKQSLAVGDRVELFKGKRRFKLKTGNRCPAVSIVQHLVIQIDGLVPGIDVHVSISVLIGSLVSVRRPAVPVAPSAGRTGPGGADGWRKHR